MSFLVDSKQILNGATFRNSCTIVLRPTALARVPALSSDHREKWESLLLRSLENGSKGEKTLKTSTTGSRKNQSGLLACLSVAKTVERFLHSRCLSSVLKWVYRTECRLQRPKAKRKCHIVKYKSWIQIFHLHIHWEIFLYSAPRHFGWLLCFLQTVLVFSSFLNEGTQRIIHFSGPEYHF